MNTIDRREETSDAAFGALVLGIVLWVAPIDGNLTPDIAFWLTAVGGILLVLGSVFNKI